MTTSDMMPFLFIVGLIVIALLVLTGVWWKMRKRGLSAGSKAKINNAWSGVIQLQDPVRTIIEADKVLDLALNELGFKGSVADKLKKAGPRFSDVNAVWRVHKLRNRLAHETGAKVSEREAEEALKVFDRAMRDLF